MDKYEFVMASIIMLWVLLPLIPAVLIYWLFPDASAFAMGKLLGFTVKAGGAFAAYLIVVLVIKPWAVEEINQAGGYLHPAWTVTGAIRIIDKNGAVSHPGETFFRKLGIITEPPMNSFADPTFTIIIPEGPGGIPRNVYLRIPDYGQTLQLRLTNIDRINKTAGIAGEAVEIQEPRPSDSEYRRLQTEIPAAM